MSVSTLVLDLDHLADDTLAGALKKLEPYEYVLHSSHSDRPGQRCVRVVLLLSRPVAREEWERFWSTATAQLGVPVDQHCKDASRLYFLPTRPHDALHKAADGSGYHYAAHAGALIDVDAILALAPPVKPHEVHEAPAGAEYREPTDEGRATAVRLLGEVWPESGKRHEAYLALAGGLIRAGWSIEQVAQFSYDVVSVKTPDYDDISKRLADARTSYNKIMAGEPATGWPRLVECLAQGDVTADAAQKAVDEVRVALGLVTADDPEFLAKMTEAARGRGETKLQTPTWLEFKTTIEKTRDKLKRSKSGRQGYLGKLLAKVLKGDFLSEPDEDREEALKCATLTVVRAAPPGTLRKHIHDLLLPSAGFMELDLPQIVAEAIEQVAREVEEVKKTSRTLPEPVDDEQLRSQLTVTDRGTVMNCGENILRVLRYSRETRENLRFNELSKHIEAPDGEFKGVPPKHMAVAVSNWLGSHWKIHTRPKQVKEQLIFVAETQFGYNPIAEYLAGLEWDGTSRIDEWLICYCGAEDTPLVRQIASRFMISMIARGFEPGCKMDNVLVLEGKQGTRKSAMVAALGEPWHSNTALVVGSNDARMMTCRKWVIEFPELSSLANVSPKVMKGFLSQEDDDFRPPYGEEPETFKRTCVLIGSTNEHEYLNDPTGNRRFWPVRITRCDDAALARDRDQLFAEAVVRYRKGERWWFEEDEQLTLDDFVEERSIDNPAALKIQRWLATETRQVGAKAPRTKFTLLDVAESALGITAVDALKNTRWISEAMRIAGMQKVEGRSGGKKRERYWQYTPPTEHPDPTALATPTAPTPAVAPTPGHSTPLSEEMN